MGSEIVDRHLELCDELLEILNEENRTLRNNNTGADDALIEKKKSFLPRLDESLANLKRLHEESPELMPALQSKLTAAQKKIMRILLLDRENEQLLLKTVLPKIQKPVQKKPLKSIKNIYERHKIPQ